MIPALAFMLAAYTIPRIIIATMTVFWQSPPDRGSARMLAVVLCVAAVVGILLGLLGVLVTGAGSALSAAPRASMEPDAQFRATASGYQIGIENLTATNFPSCELTIGDYAVSTSLSPRETATISVHDFKSGGSRAIASDLEPHLVRGLRVDCVDAQARRVLAVVPVGR